MTWIFLSPIAAIKEGVTKDEADQVKAKLEETGATIEIK
jgi:ribosomal protein L7/L12